jgi:serine/threonine-protein kinase
VRQIVGQLAGVLQYVHTRGLIHSDIKPSNVMIGRDGVVKLLDFGLVRTGAWLASSTSASTQSVDLKGTLRYMAPEQFNKHDPIDRRVDLYGLACVAYEALSGRPVVDASDLEGIIQQKLGFVLPARNEIGHGISEHMRSFLEQGLNRHPEQRNVDLDKLAEWAAPVDPGS